MPRMNVNMNQKQYMEYLKQQRQWQKEDRLWTRLSKSWEATTKTFKTVTCVIFGILGVTCFIFIVASAISPNPETISIFTRIAAVPWDAMGKIAVAMVLLAWVIHGVKIRLFA